MALDFRASQLRTAKLISSGSSAGGAKLVFYDIAADDATTPNQGVIDLTKFVTSSIGEDVFLYVSGTVTSGSSTDRITVFGGSAKVSGVLNANSAHIDGILSANKLLAGYVDIATPTISFAEDTTTGFMNMFPGIGIRGIGIVVEGVYAFFAANLGVNTQINAQAGSEVAPAMVLDSWDNGLYSLGGPEGGIGISIGQSKVVGITSASVVITSSLTVIDSITTPALTGSLTKLADGTSYLREGDGISLTSGSDGSVEVGSLWAVSGAYAVVSSSVALIPAYPETSYIQFRTGLVIHRVSGSEASEPSSGVIIYGGDSKVSNLPLSGGTIHFIAGTGSRAEGPPAGDGGNIVFEAGTGGSSTTSQGGQGGGFIFTAASGGSPTDIGQGGAGGSFRFYAGNAGENVGVSAYSAQGGGVEFSMGSSSNPPLSLFRRDGDFIVRGGPSNPSTSHASFEQFEKFALGVANGVTSTITGADSFLFVSGAKSSRGTSGGRIVVLGGDMHISGNLTVDGTGPAGAGEQRMLVAAPITTLSTVATMAGQFYWNSTDWTSTPTTAKLRVIGNVSAPPHTASIQLYNLTQGSFALLETDTTYLNITASNPTFVSSFDIFSSLSASNLYEVQVSSSLGSDAITLGGIELYITYGTYTAIETLAGTSDTMADTDSGKTIRCTNAGTVTISVPAGLTAGTTVEYIQEGAGRVEISSASVTLRHPSSFSPFTAAQWSSIVVTSLDDDEAIVRGDLSGSV